MTRAPGYVHFCMSLWRGVSRAAQFKQEFCTHILMRPFASQRSILGPTQALCSPYVPSAPFLQLIAAFGCLELAQHQTSATKLFPSSSSPSSSSALLGCGPHPAPKGLAPRAHPAWGAPRAFCEREGDGSSDEASFPSPPQLRAARNR